MEIFWWRFSIGEKEKKLAADVPFELLEHFPEKAGEQLESLYGVTLLGYIANPVNAESRSASSREASSSLHIDDDLKNGS